MPKKITNEEIDKRIFNLVGDEYYRVSDYVKGNQKIVMHHTECGEDFEVTTNHFIYDGIRCKCKINTMDPEDFKLRFESLAKGEYIQLTPYIRSFKKIRVLHNKCGNTFEVLPKDFTRGSRCPHCAGNKRKTTKEFSDEVHNLTDGEYVLLTEYKNNRTPVTIRHDYCGKEYQVIPKDFLRGNRCPYCKQSKGERLVETILNSLNITYDIQKGYEDLKTNGSYLRFDFYIPSHNLLIEYDGIQHHEPVKYFGGDKKLKSQQRRDKKKNDYARLNNINLLRVNYLMTPDIIKNEIINTIDKCKAETLSDRV